MAILLIYGLLFINQLYSVNALTCFCKGHCPDFVNDPLKNGTCEAEVGGSCFQAVEEVYDPDTNEYVPEHSYGCLREEGGEFQCKGHIVPHSNPTSIGCCSDEDYCNLKLKGVEYELPPMDPIGPDTEGGSMQFELMVLLCSLTAIFIVALLIIVLFFLYYEKKEETHRKEIARDPEMAIRLYPGNIHDLIEESSGSGSGVPRIVQQTICKQIDMGQHPKLIGRGRFGEVWEATFRGIDKIAVKAYHPKHDISWSREAEIYSTPLRNENILRFIAADIRGFENSAQRLLITEYHHYGSLFDFLRRNFNQRPDIDSRIVLNMAMSIASGLSFLHMPVSDTSRGKPKIAHRDIKTKNILVKDDLTCCIGDFGLAVSDNDQIEKEVLKNERESTIRYMAPEVLELHRNKTRAALNSIESYKRADIYSFGLVVWELCMGTYMGTSTPKELPKERDWPYDKEYLDFERMNPKMNEREIMDCIVNDKKYRPKIPINWDMPNDPHEKVAKIIRECWNEKSEARLPMLNVKKSLRKVLNPKSEEDLGSPQKYAGISSNGSTLPMDQRVYIS